MDSHLVILIVISLALEGIFSGSEIALVASDINRMRNRALAGSRSAAVAVRLLEHPEWYFATTLIGTDLCVITGSVLATSLAIGAFGPVRGQLLSVLVMVPAVILFGEIIPKSIFQQNAERIVLRIAWVIWISSILLYPVVFVVSRIARGAVLIISNGRDLSSGHITKSGLSYLVRQKMPQSDLTASEREMVRRAFDFSEATAGNVMAPIANVTALEENTTLGEAASLLKSKGFSRMPVYRGEVFNIVGILHTFDLLKLSPENFREKTARHATMNVTYVPETKRASDLLLELQKKGEQMAVVVDEYGGAVGIVTVEDILEEVVGEIEDEYDRGERLYKKTGKGRFLVQARMDLEDFREKFRVEIPAGDYETIGGFLLYKMGRIPKTADTYKFGNTDFVIQEADPKSIKQILVILPFDLEIPS